MQKLFSVPFAFLFIASCIGLLLRLHLILPMSWLKYTYWLHAHSHIMFLGWVFNTLYLAYISNFSLTDKRYKILFIIIQALLLGMLFSFPLQGYGAASIILSVLHTIAVYTFCFWLFQDLDKQKPSASIWHTKVSLVLFIISSLGPFILGALIANGLGQSRWYHFAVYYYLHFQYNGVFIFGVLSLFYNLLEGKGIPYNLQLARKSGILLFVSLFPGYFLSTLWASPGLLFNIIGGVGAIVQLWGLYYFITTIQNCSFTSLNSSARLMMRLSFIAFVLKSFLQLISAHPFIAKLAFDIRPFTIAYLHLVLIGVVTFFLLAWYIEKKLKEFASKFIITLVLIGFIGSELCMIVIGIPFTTALFKTGIFLLLLFSICLCFAFSLFLKKMCAINI